jgi:hypothetical protein
VRDHTQLHLSTAEENRSLANALIAGRALHPASSRGAAVVAFYAAVLYVNAYLWERLEIEPANHFERERFIRSVSDLRSFASHYTRLQAISLSARCTPGARISPDEAQLLIEISLEAIRVTIIRALDTDS